MMSADKKAEEIVYEWQHEQPMEKEQRRIAPLLIKITQALTLSEAQGFERGIRESMACCYKDSRYNDLGGDTARAIQKRIRALLPQSGREGL